MSNKKTVYEYERIMEHDKWNKEIPFIELPEGYKIKVIPPFAGAIVRFLVKKQDVSVSVYLDCYDNLGCMNKPYWEIYPASNHDTFRCYIHETDDLIAAIVESIEIRLCSQ